MESKNNKDARLRLFCGIVTDKVTLLLKFPTGKVVTCLRGFVEVRRSKTVKSYSHICR
jgi:hypothetical protein